MLGQRRRDQPNDSTAETGNLKPICGVAESLCNMDIVVFVVPLRGTGIKLNLRVIPSYS